VFGVSGIKKCVTSCGVGLMLTKDSNGSWVCVTACLNNVQFYFENNLGDIECSTQAATETKCVIAGNRLSADNGAHLKFHVRLPLTITSV
jgi:hypothetical protein